MSVGIACLLNEEPLSLVVEAVMKILPFWERMLMLVDNTEHDAVSVLTEKELLVAAVVAVVGAEE